MGKAILSIVLLNADARLLSSREVAQAASRAYGEDFAETTKESGERPEGNAVIAAEDRPGQFMVVQPPVGLAVISHNKPYVRDKAAAAERIRDFRQKVAMQQHVGWISVDWLGDLPPDGPDLAYQFIGPLVAEFVTDKTLAIYCTSTKELNAFHPDLLAALRGPTPLEAFGMPPPMPIAAVQAGDAAMDRAVAEARQRWPEFVAAFANRRPMQGFAVKAPFGDDGNREFMWVEVESITDKAIRGKLVSEPVQVPKLKLGDPVTVALDNLNDWIYDAGGEMVGGFTAKVLEQRASQPAAPATTSTAPVAASVAAQATATTAAPAPTDRAGRIRALLTEQDTRSLAGSMGQMLAGAAFCLAVGFVVTSVVCIIFYALADTTYIGWTGWFSVYLVVLVPLLIWIERKSRPDYLGTAAANSTLDPSSRGEYEMNKARMKVAAIATMLTWGPRSLLDGWHGISGRWSIRKHHAFDRAAEIVEELSTAGAGVPAKTLIRGDENPHVFLAAMRWLDRNDWIGRSTDGSKVWISSVAQKKLVSKGLWSPVQVAQALRR